MVTSAPNVALPLKLFGHVASLIASAMLPNVQCAGPKPYRMSIVDAKLNDVLTHELVVDETSSSSSSLTQGLRFLGSFYKSIQLLEMQMHGVSVSGARYVAMITLPLAEMSQGGRHSLRRRKGSGVVAVYSLSEVSLDADWSCFDHWKVVRVKQAGKI